MIKEKELLTGMIVPIIWTKMVKITNPDTNEVWDYHIDKKLIPLLENIKKSLSMKDKDYVMIIDGYEGAGKSTFAQQLGRYVEPSLNLSRICMTSKDFQDAITHAKKGQCVIYDEAVTGLSAGASISKVGKLLRSMMMQMRQKNLFVIILLPTIFELNKYSALYRAKSLFRVYEKNGKRGYWVGYNRKDIKRLYLKGKRSYSYLIKSLFNGRFYGKYVVDEKKYREKKEKALFQIGEEPEKIGNIKHKIIIGMHLEEKKAEEIYQTLQKWKIPLSKRQIYHIIQKFEES